jgi:hypothetical protein
MNAGVSTKRWPALVLGFVCGIALTITILWLMWMLDERSISMVDRPAILATAAADLLDDWEPNRTLYLREGLTWDVDKIIVQLRNLRPSLEVHPWAERPIYPPCDHPMTCGPEDNVYVEVDSEPYRYIAFVEYRMSACAGDMILVRFASSWHPVTKRWFCV